MVFVELDLGVSGVVRAALESFETRVVSVAVFVVLDLGVSGVVKEDCRAMEVVDLHSFATMQIDHEDSRCHQGSVVL